MEKIILAIIEDDEELREQLVRFLKQKEDFIILFAGSSVESYLYHAFHKVSPDIILLDITLPGISGCEGVKLLKSRFPETEIIMYTIHDEEDIVFESICNGAAGYIVKNTPLTEIAGILRQTAAGGSFMTPSVARKLLERIQQPTQEKTEIHSLLTEKEEEIVHALVDGLSYKSIAAAMNISIDTVRTHVKNIYKKLHIHSRSELLKKT